jgi:hypothetical protein
VRHHFNVTFVGELAKVCRWQFFDYFAVMFSNRFAHLQRIQKLNGEMTRQVSNIETRWVMGSEKL